MSRLILASCSPRRSELLKRIGLSFDTYAPKVDETCVLPAEEAVMHLSQLKAIAAAEAYPCCFVLAADTLVSCDGVVLGKPADHNDAICMLHLLSGRTHQVYTGITVISPDGRVFSDRDRTDVTFVSLTDDEILSYVHSGEPMDKAGAYALQGRAGMWINHLNGSDSSVIGLPLYLVRSLLLRAGFPILPAAD